MRSLKGTGPSQGGVTQGREGQAEDEVAYGATKRCFFRIPLDSHGLDPSLEMAGTVLRALI